RGGRGHAQLGRGAGRGPVDSIRALAGAQPHRVYEPPVPVADRRALPPAELHPDGRLPRADRPGGRQPQELIHPLRRAAESVPAARRGGRECVAMNVVNAAVLAELQGLDLQGDGRAGAERLGKVAAPPNKESTSEVFYFWVETGKLCERTQIVTT